MLIGEYRHTVDEKGRLIIPSKLRGGIGDSFVLCKGFEGCLFLYSSAEWLKFSDQLYTLPRINKDARTFRRFFIGSAYEDKFDKQGRVLIPAALKKYAQLEKDVAVVGMLDRIEIWNPDLWEKMSSPTEDELDEIAEHMEDSGLRI